MADRVAVVIAPTAVEVTCTAAVVAPDETVTVAGTPAAGSLLLRSTISPPAGAGALIVTVSVPFSTPPKSDAGLTDTAETANGCTVIVAALVEPYAEPEMATVTVVATSDVTAENEALVAPWATVTDAGTLTAPLSLESDTATPPAGAGAPSVTVPATFAEPPVMSTGLMVTLATVTRMTCRVAVALRSWAVAVMTTSVVAAGGVVVMGNVVLV